MQVQSRIEEIVNQFYSGTKQGLARAGEIYRETIFDAEGGCRDGFDYTGTAIPNKHLEFRQDDAERLDGFVTEERIDALLDGAEPTENERQEYRRRVIAEAEHGDADSDYVPGYFIYKLRHTDGREVLALETVIGYSFSGVENTFHGLFSSVDDALKYLSTWAFVVRQD